LIHPSTSSNKSLKRKSAHGKEKLGTVDKDSEGERRGKRTMNYRRRKEKWRRKKEKEGRREEGRKGGREEGRKGGREEVMNG
jgi:hypothetical protein